MRHYWTNDEVQYLEQHAATMRAAEIAKHLGLTERQVQNKAAREDIAMHKSGAQHHMARHSPDDIRLAKLLIEDGELSGYQIDELMGFTKGHTSAIRRNTIHKEG